ncbi:uncharacterized protein [Spinacia oleracea]|uniref:Uncharacterized protein isoform X2 n=1 Tax=Spinacia oleracea TaxID=3562 RepID=A0A9R0HSA6_SPIOL|nr:uncharacterized protein LOC110775674 isoform X2 [Spinacia oleracea]
MATFRPPQFSDDVAWLPAWLQPNQSAVTPSQGLTSEENSRHSLQDVDIFKGENSQVKEPYLSTHRGSRYNICHLYLSGEESSPATLTPSCDKVLHLNLHLSSDGTSSNISNTLLHISLDDKLDSALALVGTKEKSQCNIGHDSSKMNIVPSPSSEKYSGYFANQIPLTNDAGKNTLEIFNSNCAKDDDISDAVELSIAASEALVIHKIVQNESFSAALSTSAILEVALRVKQARLDELKDSSNCFEDSDNTADILSDLGDSDIEDACKDVGLYISSLDNTPLEDLSASRVKETPLSEIPGEDTEVQCKWQGDQEIYFNNCLVTELQENNPETNKLKDPPAEIFDNEKLELDRNLPLDSILVNQSQNGHLDDLQLLQEEKNDMTYVEGFAHQLEVNSLPRSQHLSKARLDSIPTKWHSRYADINKLNNRSSCRFQSRWFGGWTGMEIDDCGELKSKSRKTIPNFFIGETSYLSESIDVFPDQNSVVHNQHLSSNTTASVKPFEGSCKSASKGAFVSQEVVKDSASFIDPLCSTVPCSISAQIGDSLLQINNNDDNQVLDAFKSFPTGIEIPLETAQTSSGHYDENVSNEKHNGLDLDDAGPYPVVRRQLTSLKTYSTGLPGNSPFSFKRNLNCEFVSCGENDARVLSDSTDYTNDKDTTKQPPVKSTPNCATSKSNQENQEVKLLSLEQCISCTKTSDKGGPEKQPPIKSIFSGVSATNDKEIRVENACERVVLDQFERNGVELQVNVEDNPTSPLVLCHRKRRFKAPKINFSDASAASLLKDQAPASDKTCDEARQIPKDQFRNIPRSEISARKRVRFSNVDFVLQIPQGQLKKHPRRVLTCENRSSSRLGYRPENCYQEQVTASQEVKERLTKCRIKGRKRTIFQGLDFLLTGFSKKKEKEIEGIVRKHGGMVLSDIPAPPPYPSRRRSLRFNAERLPVVLCTKKLQTTRFLYGCAVHAFLLKVGWAYDSIRAGSVLPPDKYVILSNQSDRMQNQIGKSIYQNDNDYIFDKVGIMLHGTHSFCTKLTKVIKHGRGHVYKSLQWLVQSLEKKKISVCVIVAEDENRATRHLKKCASEQKIAVMPARWITNSLFEGKLLPLTDNYRSSQPRAIRVPELAAVQEWSPEI